MSGAYKHGEDRRRYSANSNYRDRSREDRDRNYRDRSRDRFHDRLDSTRPSPRRASESRNEQLRDRDRDREAERAIAAITGSNREPVAPKRPSATGTPVGPSSRGTDYDTPDMASTASHPGADKPVSKQEFQQWANLFCQRVYWFITAENANKRSTKTQQDQKRLNSTQSDFLSVSKAFEFSLKREEDTQGKCTQRINGIDHELWPSFSSLVGGLTSGSDPGTSSQVAASEQKAFETQSSRAIEDLKSQMMREIGSLRKELNETRLQNEKKEEELKLQYETATKELKRQHETETKELRALLERESEKFRALLEQKTTESRALLEQETTGLRALLKQETTELRALLEQETTELRALLEQESKYRQDLKAELLRDLDGIMEKAVKKQLETEASQKQLGGIMDKAFNAKVSNDLQTWHNIQATTNKYEDTFMEISALLSKRPAEQDAEQDDRISTTIVRGIRDHIGLAVQGINTIVERLQTEVSEQARGREQSELLVKNLLKNLQQELNAVTKTQAENQSSIKQDLMSVQSSSGALNQSPKWMAKGEMEGIAEDKAKKVENNLQAKLTLIGEHVTERIEKDTKARLSLEAQVQGQGVRIAALEQNVEGIRVGHAQSVGSLEETVRQRGSEQMSQKKDIAAIAEKLERTRQDFAGGFDGLQLQIQNLNAWVNNFNTRALYRDIVDHINATIPNGVIAQLRRVSEKVDLLEQQERLAKRRKTPNGHAVAVNGNH